MQSGCLAQDWTAIDGVSSESSSGKRSERSTSRGEVPRQGEHLGGERTSKERGRVH